MRTRTRRRIVPALVAALLAGPAQAGMMVDDPLLFMAMIDQLEWRDAEDHRPLVWDAQAWLGYDLNKLWLKTEGERVGGENEEAEIQALYGHAIAPYWDLQLGWRHDVEPDPHRNWAVIGVQGLAPYFFEVDASLFLGEDGRSAARLEAEYELLLTQRLVLSPEIELDFYGKDDPRRGLGAGLSEAEAGLRLRYEIRREFAPYVGVNWTGLYGDSADRARDQGEAVRDTQFVIGLRAWF